MPKTSDMKDSKFLKQADVGAGVLVTVTGCSKHNVAKEGAEPEMKWCLEFAETDKPLPLNGINTQICENILGSDDTDDWHGQKIVLYVDPTVAYQGKVTGGVRVRAPKKQPAAKPAVVAPLDDSDIPF